MNIKKKNYLNEKSNQEGLNTPELLDVLEKLIDEPKTKWKNHPDLENN